MDLNATDDLLRTALKAKTRQLKLGIGVSLALAAAGVAVLPTAPGHSWALMTLAAGLLGTLALGGLALVVPRSSCPAAIPVPDGVGIPTHGVLRACRSMGVVLAVLSITSAIWLLSAGPEGGPWPIVAGAAAGLSATTLLAGWRARRQPRVPIALTQTGVVIILRGGGSATVAWDGLEILPYTRPGRFRIELPVEVRRPMEPSQLLLTSGLTLPLWDLLRVIGHLRDHPDERGVLGTAEGAALVAALRGEPPSSGHWSPAWFRPPVGLG